MKNWLEKSPEMEKPLLEMCCRQARQVVDDLLPQIKLAALENDNASIINLKMAFEFDDKDGARIITEGYVDFPAKRAYAEAVCK